MKNGLSPRQTEILRLLALGQSGKEIAHSLNISIKTVGIHKRRLMDKLGINRTMLLGYYAIQKGIVKIPGVTVDTATQASA